MQLHVFGVVLVVDHLLNKLISYSFSGKAQVFFHSFIILSREMIIQEGHWARINSTKRKEK